LQLLVSGRPQSRELFTASIFSSPPPAPPPPSITHEESTPRWVGNPVVIRPPSLECHSFRSPSSNPPGDRISCVRSFFSSIFARRCSISRLPRDSMSPPRTRVSRADQIFPEPSAKFLFLRFTPRREGRPECIPPFSTLTFFDKETLYQSFECPPLTH